MSDHEAELRRQATAAGVYLDLAPLVLAPHPTSGCVARVPIPGPTADETEQLLVWLDQWTDGGYPRDRHEAAWCCVECGRPCAEQPDSWTGWAICQGCTETQARHGGSGKLQSGMRQIPIASPLLDPPAGFELIRHSWCPRCDRAAGDPLGRRGTGRVKYRPPTVRTPGRSEWVKPAPPELEIGQGCSHVLVGKSVTGSWVWVTVADRGDDERSCGARRLFRWGLRRKAFAVAAEPRQGLQTVQGMRVAFSEAQLNGEPIEAFRGIHFQQSYGGTVRRSSNTAWAIVDGQAGVGELLRAIDGPELATPELAHLGQTEFDMWLRWVYADDDGIHDVLIAGARIVEMDGYQVEMDCREISHA